MNRPDPTRREFLLRLARGAAYAAPLVATFAVAPDLLAQPGSLPGHHHTHTTAAPQQTEQPGAPAPSERHPPPSQKQPTERKE